MKKSSKLFISIALLAASLLTFAQKPQKDNDRFVRLMSAQSVRLLEIDGRKFRRADGPARFLHNDTWLICDTALWSVDEKVIYAIGHVSIEQENTELTGEKLTYYVDRNLAEFRGTIVQLQDKENNVLRTRNLDYNTKDSVAIFREGGAMRDKDGQIIESSDGTYDSKTERFDFYHDVNMFSDSTFVKTSHLIYESPTSLATFPVYTEAWKDDGMLSGNSGWYNNETGEFFFTDNVHALSSSREGWCDSLFYRRNSEYLEMLGNAQVNDTLRNVSAMAGKMEYTGKDSRIRLLDDPVVLLELIQHSDSSGTAPARDSVYMRADTIIYTSFKRCEVDTAVVTAAAERTRESLEDPVANIRAKAAEEAAKARQEAIDNDPNSPPELKTEYKQKQKEEQERKEREAKEREAKAKAVADSLKTAALKARKDSLVLAGDTLTLRLDSLKAMADSLKAGADSLKTGVDSLKLTADSSAVGFLYAVGKVKVFRENMQAVCDSLVYCDLDSLARLFKKPVVWNDVRHQYNADSLYLVVKDGRMQKAMLLSNAFIHVDEDGKHYDQIRSTEMAAFFDPDMELTRFDAMGSTTAIFYIKEKEKIATANRKETTMMSATLENGDISRITYYETPKSDASPVAQMRVTDQFLKGYDWTPDLRPRGPWELTSRVPKAPERSKYAERPRAQFRQTERYFPGYMGGIYREIARADSIRRVNAARQAVRDTVSVMADSLNAAAVASAGVNLNSNTTPLAVKDSLAATVAADSISLAKADSIRVADSLYNAMTPAQKRAFERQKKIDAFKARIEERRAEKERKWAELDAREKEKQDAKLAAKKAKKEAREQKQIARLLKQKEKEDALREKMKAKYQKLIDNGKLDFKQPGE